MAALRVEMGCERLLAWDPHRSVIASIEPPTYHLQMNVQSLVSPVQRPCRVAGDRSTERLAMQDFVKAAELSWDSALLLAFGASGLASESWSPRVSGS